MSEQDLQYAFAEAMLIGKPDYQGPCELVTGISPIHIGEQVSDEFFRDLKFGHYITERLEQQAVMGSSSHSLSVKAQLAKAQTKASVFSIIKGVVTSYSLLSLVILLLILIRDRDRRLHEKTATNAGNFTRRAHQ